MAGYGCIKSANHRIPCGRPESDKCQSPVEVNTSALPEACHVLYRWLLCIRGCDSTKATSSRQKAKAHYQSHRTIQLHVETKGISFGPAVSFLFQEVGESHWCHQVFHLSLQSRQSITCIALPRLSTGKSLVMPITLCCIDEQIGRDAWDDIEIQENPRKSKK